MKTYVYNNNNYIKVYNADCLEIMQRLVNKGMQVDAIITDPPKDINGNPIRHFFKLGGYKLNFDNINFKNLNSLIKKQ